MYINHSRIHCNRPIKDIRAYILIFIAFLNTCIYIYIVFAEHKYSAKISVSFRILSPVDVV